MKVKYKSSVLGAAWTMLNPILYLAVFSLVFKVVLRNNIPNFAVYLLSGLLAWNLFTTSVGLGARAVVDNGNLVTKVYFPREILPLASVGAALVDFVMQLLVLVAFMVGFHVFHPGMNLLLFPLSMFALLIFTSALSMWVASLNVRYRDTQYLLNLALMVWFWVTPIVYSSGQMALKLSQHTFFGVSWFYLYLVNPMAGIVFGMQRALYGEVHPIPGPPVLVPVSVGWLAALLGIVSAGSVVLLLLSWRTFFKLSGDFAEEL